MTLAYYNSLRGLIPCKVTAITDDNLGMRFALKLTASRYPFTRGDVLLDCSAHNVIPRHAVRRRRYSAAILPYSWRDVLVATP